MGSGEKVCLFCEYFLDYFCFCRSQNLNKMFCYALLVLNATDYNIMSVYMHIVFSTYSLKIFEF